MSGGDHDWQPVETRYGGAYRCTECGATEGDPEDGPCPALVEAEVDPCCLMYRSLYLVDHERDCPVRRRHVVTTVTEERL